MNRYWRESEGMQRRVLRGLPTDHPYLHKDFHGALSFAVEYVDTRFGQEALRQFLRGAARNVYQPLIADMKRRGLRALEEHWRQVFSAEGGHFKIIVRDNQIVMEVLKCPAILHMKERRYAIAAHFCETTRIVNETIAREAGWKSAVDYDQEQGACVQRFWKEDER